jgi:hypothetical protein
MAEFWMDYGWPTAWTVIKILIIVMPLLLAVAYLTYFERKVIGAMQLRKGPNVVGPLRPASADRRRHEAVFQGDRGPDRANRVVFVIAPMITFVLALVAWAVIPFGPGMVLADINVGILYLFGDLLAGRLRHHHGRVGQQLEICLSRRHAVGGADGVLRGLDRLRHHHCAALRRLAEPLR